ncbi:MAG TPA: biosynthetic-type acetolactate synthase large subunit [Clostridiaceae bacterium]|nr:biosynthetic-type acetolactate synthase large subunit [Clostridiaceae bacterium]
MKLTGAQVIVKALEHEKINTIFGYPGAAICPFYNALLDSDIKHILTRHEQGAAHAASGYARVTGKTGVCVATSGPGATNLITGIATAYMDSIPMVAITGQVSTEMIGRDVFQEADITGATAPFCKHSYLVKKTEDLPRVMKEAFYIASTGRPGPVVVDVPIDVQNGETDFEYPESIEIRGYKPKYKGHPMQIRKVAVAIKEAKSPVICAGGGIISSGASELLLKLAEKCNIPVTTTLMGKGAIPCRHKLNLGMLGSHGSYVANYAVHHADLLIILGARVGDRAMGTAYKIAEKATVVHIDIDPAEIGKNIHATIPIVGDAGAVLADLLEIVEESSFDEWNKTIERIKTEHPQKYVLREESEYVNPKYVLSVMSDMVDEDTIVTTEVGQNQIWAANYFKTKKPGTFISSGGMGTMGYGLPSAVGAKIGRPESKVITISGDGSFQMSMQELGTVKQYRLGIKIIVFNNSRLGMVRELQKVKYCGRYSQVYMEDNPDFVQLVGAYGFRGERISRNSEVKGALERMLSDDEPYLVECIVDPEERTL